MTSIGFCVLEQYKFYNNDWATKFGNGFQSGPLSSSNQNGGVYKCTTPDFNPLEKYGTQIGFVTTITCAKAGIVTVYSQLYENDPTAQTPPSYEKYFKDIPCIATAMEECEITSEDVGQEPVFSFTLSVTGSNKIKPNTTYYVWITTDKLVTGIDYSNDSSSAGLYGENIAITNITVTFEANGGTSSATFSTKVPGETYGDLPTVTKVGYKFKGWYTANSGGEKITSTSIVPESSHTLYARWEANKLKITYHKNGAVSGTFNENQITTDTITTITVNYDTFLPNGLANYSNKNSAYLYLNRPGYRGKPGKEWCTKNDGSGITIDEATQYYGFELANDLDISIAHNDQEITLYANWEPWGVVRIYTDSGWKQAIPFVYDGTGWKQTIPFVYDGTGWKASV